MELVRTSYQLTKAEKAETIRTDASIEQIADALLSPIDVRWIDKPRGKRVKR